MNDNIYVITIKKKHEKSQHYLQESNRVFLVKDKIEEATHYASMDAAENVLKQARLSMITPNNTILAVATDRKAWRAMLQVVDYD